MFTKYQVETLKKAEQSLLSAEANLQKMELENSKRILRLTLELKAEIKKMHDSFLANQEKAA
jgi:hypothetical protein